MGYNCNTCCENTRNYPCNTKDTEDKSYWLTEIMHSDNKRTKQQIETESDDESNIGDYF